MLTCGLLLYLNIIPYFSYTFTGPDTSASWDERGKGHLIRDSSCYLALGRSLYLQLLVHNDVRLPAAIFPLHGT